MGPETRFAVQDDNFWIPAFVGMTSIEVMG
jgi:hypothetical protein